MKDNDVIKALACCNVDGCCDEECPYYTKEFKGKVNCLDEKEGLIAKALDLINRQKAEIEKLQEKIELLHSDYTYKFVKGKAKAEAYKEFAERLCEGRVSNDPVVIAAKVELSELTERKEDEGK